MNRADIIGSAITNTTGPSRFVTNIFALNSQRGWEQVNTKYDYLVELDNDFTLCTVESLGVLVWPQKLYK